jgi:hypothetical protein
VFFGFLPFCSLSFSIVHYGFMFSSRFSSRSCREPLSCVGSIALSSRALSKVRLLFSQPAHPPRIGFGMRAHCSLRTPCTHTLTGITRAPGPLFLSFLFLILSIALLHAHASYLFAQLAAFSFFPFASALPGQACTLCSCSLSKVSILACLAAPSCVRPLCCVLSRLRTLCSCSLSKLPHTYGSVR